MRLLGVHRLHHRKGGAEGVHLDHLALFRARGWTCAEFAMAHPDNEPSEWSDYFPSEFSPPSGLSSLKALPRFFYSGEARRKFARLLDTFHPDVIHAHGVYHHLTNSILKPARDRGVPIVYTLHDYKLICPAYHFYTEEHGVCEKCRGGRQWNCLTRRCTHGALAMDALYAIDGLAQWHGGALRDAVARFVGPCRFIVDKFAEHGFAKEKLRYVPNFFESADDAPASPAAVAAIRAAHGRHILYFGRLSAEKGVDILIDAAASAGAPLVIVGDGPRRDELERQAQRLRSRCVFTGHLKGAALWAQVEAASAVALPSVWYEIAPKSVLEAQARGRPIVTTRIGGLPEMVADGVNGLVVEPGDRAALAGALKRIMAMDEAQLARFGASGREQARSTFTRERYYREMTAIYAELTPALAGAA
ncbi:MAG: glycosyltransferase family 4 protein [Hyphomicrobiales bacterium]|nr:glycosyltransferase family 4 protein [Hyphomicrobiales bacterium]MBV8664333.1 glycosyltransferase family 4 protein [Hyphomicrobiales bacterium]